ncbi:hypothetical protein CANARDRAFT_193444 [[Candida] arabinofermentans NRRL YB-2248]|uniref:RNA helicase n=1 Tax=[Candida] arabinofermentans NRRL YB-2248 TaxID=983967 RepID=A0A1E4T8Y6_9ASCO|nr:hypothetical protein CANARDRAFT_193444 [[Candida] arabinofermentans NRRL YB-2248]
MDDDDGHDDDDDDDDPMRLLRTINEKNKKNIPEHEPSTEKFDKCLYQESQFISDLTDEEIKALRLREGITIRGKRAVRPVLTWSQLGIPTSILSVIENLGYDSPTTIQGEALPNIMSGNDLIGIAKTGSGKTLAFLLPLFRQLISSSKTGGIISGRATPRALIMTPTRELALQILKESKPFLDMLDLKGCCCYGGQPINQQIAELKKGCNLIVATPGRLMDLLCANGGRVLALNHVTYMVLDEADRMFDLGFEPQVMKIVNAVRPDRQTVLFSATFPYKMEGLARKILIKPVEILVGSKNLVNEKIEQKFELLDDVSLKFNKLLQVLGHFREQDADGKILIFVDRQDSCDTLVSRLIARGYPSMSLHGGKEQVDRDSTISDFKNGIIDTLVATSVASRGLDVKDLSLVINYDPPSHMEDYIHRVGRTGRAGNSGTSITFITPNEDRSANDIAKLFEISGSPVPEKLLELANKFREKLNKGDVKFSSGFGGKGLEKLQAIREHNKSIEKQLYDKGDDDGEEKRESDSNKKSTEPSKAMSTAEVSAATAAADIDLNDFKVVYGSAKKGPDSSNYHAKLNINDLPKNPRWLVSNRESISKVVEATSTSITTKGRYYPPGKEPGEKEDAKLYLLIEGESEHSVRTAVELFKETLVKALNAHIKEDKGKKFTIS